MTRTASARLAFTLAAFITCAPAVMAQDVAARMGSTDIKLDEIDAFLKTLGEREQAAVRTDPTLIAQAARLYLTNRAVLKEALDKKFDADPEVKAQLEKAREAVIVEAYLQSSAKTPDNYPSEAEVQAFYNANAQQLFIPRQFQISQIFIAAPKDGDAAAKDAGAKKLAAVQAKLKAPNADFSAIAKSDSDSAVTAERGGELGWVLETQLRPELLEKISSLPKGGVSEAAQLEDGYHILKLTDTKSAGPLPLADVRARIVATMREQRAAQARRAFVAQILEKNPVTVNELVLGKLVKQADQAASSAAVAPTAAASPATAAVKPAAAPQSAPAPVRRP